MTCATCEQSQAISEYNQKYDAFGRRWISTSGLADYLKCGLLFEFRCIKRMPSSQTVRRAAGTAAHKARMKNLMQKVTSSADVPMDIVTDAARDEANRLLITDDFRPETEFADLSIPDARGMTVDLATAAARADREAFQPAIQPRSVEQPLAVEYPGLPRIIVGTTDVIDLQGVIHDLKTSKRAKGQAYADASMSLSAYGMLQLAHGELPPSYLIENVIVTRSGQARHELYRTARTKEQVERQLFRFQKAMSAIEAAIFVPANPESWWCSEDWCPYWKQCPAAQ